MTPNPESLQTPDERLERLSAVLDGEATPEETQATSTFWTVSEQAQAQWHAWSAIGEGLRSSQAWRAAGDQDAAAFLQAFRDRVKAQDGQDEPHVTPLRQAGSVYASPAPRLRSPWRWAALAAGFTAAAGAAALLWPLTNPGPQPELVQTAPLDVGIPKAENAGLAEAKSAPQTPGATRPTQVDKALADATPKPAEPSGQAPVHVEGTRLVVGPAR